jgi:hypothetical protein
MNGGCKCKARAVKNCHTIGMLNNSVKFPCPGIGIILSQRAFNLVKGKLIDFEHLAYPKKWDQGFVASVHDQHFPRGNGQRFLFFILYMNKQFLNRSLFLKGLSVSQFFSTCFGMSTGERRRIPKKQLMISHQNGEISPETVTTQKRLREGTIPNFLIRERSVLRLSPKRAAAPWGPLTSPPVFSRALSIWRRSFSWRD